MEKTSCDLGLEDSFAGARIHIVNPETGDSVPVNVSPSVKAQIEKAFPELS